MNEALTVIRNVVLLIHLTGFALLLGGWAAQAAMRRYRLTTLLRSGLGIMIVSGLLVAIPLPAGIHLDYLKLGVKLAIALGIGALFGVVMTRVKAGKEGGIAFWAIGALAVVNAGIAVLWN
jgi:hypothetical protein